MEFVMSAVRLLAAGIILSAAVVAAPAFAGGDSGFYLGAGVGQANVDGDSDFSGFDSDDTGFKAIVGYNIGLVPLVDLAVEAEYVDFGKPDDSGLELEPTALAAFGLVGVNLGPIGVFAKLGAFSWDVDATFEGESASDDGTDVAYGLGARFQIASFQIRAEYEIFDVDDADVDFLSASLLYTF
jgi:opacity protein-like surface antigen